jgi:biopolymer transport protein ExbB
MTAAPGRRLCDATPAGPVPCPRMGQTFEQVMTVFRAGGWVMWPLLGLSLLSVAVILERVMFWTSRSGGGGGRGRDARLAKLGAALRRGDTASAQRLTEKDASVYSWFAAELLERTAGGGADDVEAAAVVLVESARPRVERFSLTMSTIITAAPMLGILGTVMGIIESFRLLGAREDVVVEPAAVASGIAVALYTTAFGLIVALITLFPYVAFRGAADRCFSRLEALVAAAARGRASNGPHKL